MAADSGDREAAMPGLPRASVLLVLLLAAPALALKLPAQQRQEALANQHLQPSSTRPPLLPPPSAADSATLPSDVEELDRGLTKPPARAIPAAQPAPDDVSGPASAPAPAGQPAGPEDDDSAEDAVEGASDGEDSVLDGSSDSPDVFTAEQPSPATAPPEDAIQSNRQLAPMTQEVDQPRMVSAESNGDNNAEESTAKPVAVTRQPVPGDAYAVFDTHGNICILAKLMLDLEIVYYTQKDERKKVKLSLPEDADVTGACARDGAMPNIVFSWDDVKLSILFNENEFGNTWYVSDMKLTLGMDSKNFPDARQVGTQNLWLDVQKQHTLHLFASPVDKAYYCTSEQDLDLFNGDGVHSATLLLWNVHLQPYVKEGEFGPSVNCPGGKIGRRRINENVPLAVGSTLASVTLITIAGYAVWRHFKVKKFNYDTME